MCIPQKSGTSICSSNLGSIQQLPPIPDAGAAVPESDADDDAPGINIPDDTGAPPPQDTGAPATKDGSGD